ncbi:DapH/DapD/GlmU-related protein [Carboxylicivirga sp. M1479]|uniref:DapH/DapD/GlmU-related protein n=1 Tax=Carboxylicivirga sp. M1479 TaxID=2594476 RepID=UPI0011776E7B|nr:DapH/DapD/GlmU-related protein [Carboxylicivirga sp. M1479]TRX71996.1 hypothetical protein FNN09_03045 [Carboxylicivirga sp. M1479]
MRLREVFDKEQLVRDREISSTYSPHHTTKQSIAYATDALAIENLNKNELVTAVITKEDLIELVADDMGLIVSEHPQKCYYELHNRLVRMEKLRLVTTDYVDETAEIHPTAVVSPKVQIGKNVKIGAGTIIKDNTIIGDHCVIDDYVVIGSGGMQNTTVDGLVFFLETAGGVKIEENCHILTGAIIQKPYHAFFTHIGANTKISNRCVIGHGSQVGANVMIAGSCQIAGNVNIGHSVWIGPSSTISDSITIGNNAKVRLGSVVINNIAENADVSGYFAYSHKRNMLNFLKSKK